MQQSSILKRLAQVTTRRPLLTLCGTVAVYLLLSLLALRIEIDVDFTSMVPREDPSIRHVFNTIDYFGSVDRAFIALEDTRAATDPNANIDEQNEQTRQVRECVDHIAETALSWTWTRPGTNDAEPMVPLIQGYHSSEFKRVQANQLLSRSYLFLNDHYLSDIIKRLHPGYLEARLKHGPSAAVPAELRDRDLLGIWDDYLSFWSDQQGNTSNYVRSQGSYIASVDHKFHILILNPQHPVKDMQFCMAMNERLESLRQELQQQPEWSHIKLHMVGGYISAASDFEVVQSSLIKTMLSSILGVVLLFGIAYRSLRLIVLIGIGLVPAIAASLGVTSLMLGSELSIVVSAFAAILIGLGVDFIIHLYNGFCLAISKEGSTRATAAATALERVGPGIIIGCLTSVGTFLVLATSEFRGIYELGVVTSCGLFMILVSLILIVPSFLTMWGPRKARQPRGLQMYGRFITRNPLPFGIITVILIISAIVSLAASSKLFILDDNLRNLRPHNPEYNEQLELANDLGIRFGSNKVTVYGDDEERVIKKSLAFIDSLDPLEQQIPIKLEQSFTRAELIKSRNRLRVSGLPQDHKKILARKVIATPWGDLYFESIEDDELLNLKMIKPVPVGVPPLTPESPVALQALLNDTRLDHLDMINPDQQRDNLKRMREEVDWTGIKTVLASATPEQRTTYKRFFTDLRQMQQRVEQNKVLLPSELVKTPIRSVINRFYHQEGSEHHMLIALNVIHDRSFVPLEELQQVMDIAPRDNGEPVQHNGVTVATCGVPTISHYLQKAIVGDFSKLTAIAMILVMVILLIGIRNPLHVLLAMTTVGIGLLFTLSIMRLSNTPWNIINIAVVPLIIGIGIDNSVHFLHTLKYYTFDRAGIQRVIAETGHPIMMTALTSIIGFGSLLLNAYRGIQGIGSLASIGIFACLIAALLSLPLLIIGIDWLFRKNEARDD